MLTRRNGSRDRLAAAVCHGCGDNIDPRLAWRSRRWAHGVLGVHFLYCSQGCRTTFETVSRDG